ncbi:MAG: oligosaccharide flippase family protein, partial [Clostridia bacterium]
LPFAISRITAKAAAHDKQKPLLAGITLVRIASAALIPALLLLSPFVARWMGDVRVLPSLWFTAPCILILGYSASFNGYCYGLELSRVPALSELLEQAARLLISLGLLYALRKLTAPWLAAIPVAATMLAELLGLVFVLAVVRVPLANLRAGRAWRRPVLELALPTTLTRLVNTLLRSLTAIMIPLRLQATGLSMAESTARLGMLNGMVMPILMLPCIFTSALSMVALPRLAKAEDDLHELRRLLLMCFGSSLPVAGLCGAAIYLAAPVLAIQVYRMAELAELFRVCAPLAALFALCHMSGGVIAALGQQQRSMIGTLAISAATLALTYVLTANPSYRLYGVILAQALGQAALLLWNVGVLCYWRRERLHAR